MKNFANASFPPEVISVMEQALDAAVASLPEPVHSTHVQCIAEAILRAADKGERDPQILQSWHCWNYRSFGASLAGRPPTRDHAVLEHQHQLAAAGLEVRGLRTKTCEAVHHPPKKIR